MCLINCFGIMCNVLGMSDIGIKRIGLKKVIYFVLSEE